MGHYLLLHLESQSEQLVTHKVVLHCCAVVLHLCATIQEWASSGLRTKCRMSHLIGSDPCRLWMKGKRTYHHISWCQSFSFILFFLIIASYFWISTFKNSFSSYLDRLVYFCTIPPNQDNQCKLPLQLSLTFPLFCIL